MKAIVHIGYGKTGTTAIQDVLYQNRDVLFEKGWLYTKSGLRGSGHHNLSSYGVSERVREQSLQELVEEIKDNADKNIAISSEFLMFADRAYISALRLALGEKADVQIVGYFRNQIDLIESSFFAVSKSGAKLQSQCRILLCEPQRLLQVRSKVQTMGR